MPILSPISAPQGPLWPDVITLAKGCKRGRRGEGREERSEGKGGRGKRVGSRLERAARGQVATRNQGTSEPPSSHARNLQLPPRRYTHAVGADGRQASEPINTPSRNAPARYPVCVCVCTRPPRVRPPDRGTEERSSCPRNACTLSRLSRLTSVGRFVTRFETRALHLEERGGSGWTGS